MHVSWDRLWPWEYYMYFHPKYSSIHNECIQHNSSVCVDFPSTLLLLFLDLWCGWMGFFCLVWESADSVFNLALFGSGIHPFEGDWGNGEVLLYFAANVKFSSFIITHNNFLGFLCDSFSKRHCEHLLVQPQRWNPSFCRRVNCAEGLNQFILQLIHLDLRVNFTALMYVRYQAALVSLQFQSDLYLLERRSGAWNPGDVTANSIYPGKPDKCTNHCRPWAEFDSMLR